MSTLTITRELEFNATGGNLSKSQAKRVRANANDETVALLNGEGISLWVAYKLAKESSADQSAVIAYANEKGVKLTTTLINAIVRAQRAFRSDERLSLSQALLLEARELKASFIDDSVRVRSDYKRSRYYRVARETSAEGGVLSAPASSSETSETEIERYARELREQINIDAPAPVLALADENGAHAALLANAASESDPHAFVSVAPPQSAQKPVGRKHLRRKLNVAA